MDAQTRSELKQMVEEATESVLKETLVRLGIDVDNPIDTQRDMATLREVSAVVQDAEFQRDLAHLRKWRKTMDSIQSKGFLTVVALGVTAIATATWIGAKQLVGK